MLYRGQTLGKYKIVAPLGSGGFAAVYLARDTWIDKDVAIKVPHRQNVNFPEQLQEPRLHATLDHPNIVSIATADKQENVFFIVMEYVQGDTLEELIGGGAMDLRKALDFARQATEAVRHAHGQGVIHRDLRPANMLVSRAGVLKVADFGTSFVREMAARGTTVIGNPAYMAPEQFEGKAGPESDIYSLGVTMYEMLTGAKPYETPSPSDLDRLWRGDLVQPPRVHAPSIPASVNDLVMKAMAPDRSQRYRSADELLEALETVRARRERRAGGLAPPARRDAAQAQPAPRRRRPAETTGATFCWHCHKPLHARAARCPFCGENQ